MFTLSTRSLALVLMLVVPCATAAAKPAGPTRAKQPAGAATVEARLCKLGYCDAVARKIARQPSGLAAQILKARSRPHLLYRGMDIDRAAFDPAFISTDPPDRLCFSDDLPFALGYAASTADRRLRRGEKQSLMVEAELPSHLLVNPRAQLVFHLDQTRMADIAPFIRRLGVLELRDVRYERNGDLDEAGTLKRVRWQLEK